MAARASARLQIAGVVARAGLLLGGLLALGGGCTIFGSDEVVRKVHGKTLTGRFVSPDAYGHFVQGSVLEAQGDLAGAQRAYGAAALGALEEPEPWIRLGAVQCRLGQDPTNTFERARQRDDSLASLWYERAACFLLAEKPERAVADAERAMTLGPADANNSILLYRALRAAHRDGDAEKLLRATVTHWPEDARVQAWSRAVQAGTTPPALPHLVESTRRHDTTAIDAALARGDDDGAEAAARASHVALPSLALRAVALGRLALAERTARLVLAADPASADARIALLAAADLGQDQQAFSLGLVPFAGAATPPSPLGIALLAETLRRRAPLDDVASMLPVPSPASEDAVLARVLARSAAVSPAPTPVSSARTPSETTQP
jgi:tetratricopeptide (TPR) repeat protein